MVSYLSWAANGVLFVVACFLAANTANAIFASILAPPTGAVEVSSASEAVTASTWQERSVILERNLFKSTTVERSAPPVEDIEDIEATTLPLQLLGTAAAEDPVLAWAAVQDLDTRETLVVTIGDLLKNQATVMRIERRRIVLQENGQNRELTFGDEEDAPPSVTRTARRGRAARQAPRIRQLADNRFSLPREEIEEALRDPTDILSQARFLPKYEGGEMIGFQVNSIKQGSMLQDLGLENGDVIVEFNGIPIDDPAASAELMRELTSADELDFVVEGADGQPKTMNFSTE